MNLWAVLVSGVAYFVVGAVWYGLLARPWLREIGKSKEELEQKPRDYVLSLLCELLIAFALAVSLNAFGAHGTADAIFVATLLWFGFSLLPAIVHYAYEERSVTLLAINQGDDLLGVILAAVILSLWR